MSCIGEVAKEIHRLREENNGLQDINAVLRNRIDRLHKGINGIVTREEGWYPASKQAYQVHKLQQCIHGNYRYEGCDSCTNKGLEILLIEDKDD